MSEIELGTFSHVGRVFSVRQTDVMYKIAVYSDTGNPSMTIRRIASSEPIVEFQGKFNGNFPKWKTMHYRLAMEIYRARRNAEWLSGLYRINT